MESVTGVFGLIAFMAVFVSFVAAFALLMSKQNLHGPKNKSKKENELA